MTKQGKLNFAPFIAAACLLWVIAAATGSQGFTAIIVLLGIAGACFKRPNANLPVYGWIFIAAFLWISLSALWSDAGGNLASGSLSGEDFAIDVASLRIGGVAIFGFLAIGAALTIKKGFAEKSNFAMLVVILFHCLLLTAVYFYREPILGLAYPDEPKKALFEGIQNIQRAANSVAVILPIGIAALWNRFDHPGIKLFVAATVVGMLAVFQMLGSQSAVLSMLLMLLGFIIAWLWPRGGLKGLLRTIAVYVMLAPPLIYGLTKLIISRGLHLPESFQTRLFSWDYTLSKIFENPWIGHGLESSGTWRETYVTRPEWLDQLVELSAQSASSTMNKFAWEHYPIVPGHPHNMPLELWAETGLIGAFLISATIWFAANRMPPITHQNRAAGFAAAGLIGASLPLFSFAYSAWNDAYWGMIATAICAVILLSKKATT